MTHCLWQEGKISSKSDIVKVTYTEFHRIQNKWVYKAVRLNFLSWSILMSLSWKPLGFGLPCFSTKAVEDHALGSMLARHLCTTSPVRFSIALQVSGQLRFQFGYRVSFKHLATELERKVFLTLVGKESTDTFKRCFFNSKRIQWQRPPQFLLEAKR